MNWFFPSGGQSIGASALASFLPEKTQGWSASELTGWISLQSNLADSQESSPTPQFKSTNSLVLSFLYSPPLTSIYDYWKNQLWLDRPLLANNVSAFNFGKDAYSLEEVISNRLLLYLAQAWSHCKIGQEEKFFFSPLWMWSKIQEKEVCVIWNIRLLLVTKGQMAIVALKINMWQFYGSTSYSLDLGR